MPRGTFILFHGAFIPSYGMLVLLHGAFNLLAGTLLLLRGAFLLSRGAFILSCGTFRGRGRRIRPDLLFARFEPGEATAAFSLGTRAPVYGIELLTFPVNKRYKIPARKVSNPGLTGKRLPITILLASPPGRQRPVFSPGWTA